MKNDRFRENSADSPDMRQKTVQQAATFSETAEANAIKLTLLHPSKSLAVQTWRFDDKPIIKIGRSSDNHVMLNSAVVSRHHVGLFRQDSGWEIINFGSNGTYWKGKLISQALVVDGMIICLGRSGPFIKIHLVASEPEQLPKDWSRNQAATKPPANNYATFIRY